MQQNNPLEYRSGFDDASKTKGAAVSAAVASFLLIAVVNFLIIGLEAVNAGLGALAIAFTISPIANGTLIIIALARTPFVCRRLSNASMFPYLFVSLLLPVAATFFNIRMAHDIR